MYLRAYAKSLIALKRAGCKIKSGFDTVTVKVYNNDLNVVKNLLVDVEQEEIEI